MRKSAPLLAISFLVVNTIGLAWIITLLQVRHRDDRKLRVDLARLDAEVRLDQAIRIPFDLPLVSRDQVGQPVRWVADASVPASQRENAGPVTFDPPLRGSFHWGDFDTIEFRPEERLRPGSAYTGRISPRLRAWDGSPVDSKQTFTIATPALGWTALVQHSVAVDGSIVAALRFSDLVSPDQLSGRIAVRTARGRELDWEPVTHAPEREHRILVDVGDLEAIDVTLQAGIRGEGGPRGLPETETRRLTLERKLAVQEVSAETSTWGAPYLTVRFNRELDPTSVTDRVSVEALSRGAAAGPLPVRIQASGSLVTLTGGLEHGTHYRIRIQPGVRSESGHELAALVSRQIEVGDRSTGLRFTSANPVHFRQGALLLPVETVNVAELEITALRIYRNNLVHFRNEGRPNRWNASEFESLGHPLGRLVRRTGGARNVVQRTNLDLREILRDSAAGGEEVLPGATVVTVRDPQNYWTRECKLVLVTDLGLLVKRSPAEVVVWVSALGTTNPVEGAEITVYSRTNQVLHEGRTDADGLARFPVPAKPGAVEPPFLVVASRGEDVTYLALADGELSDAGFEVDGSANVGKGLRGFVCPERGIYRPGETAHLTAVVRQVAAGATPAAPTELVLPGEFPVQFRVKKPDGSSFGDFTATLSPQGIAHADVTVPAYCPTGVYTVSVVLPGHEEVFADSRFQVEDFIPNRMEVTLAAPSGRWAPGQALEIRARGAHLFGGPAADRRVSAHAVLVDAPFVPAGWDGFEFGDPARESTSVRLPVGEIRLDDNGEGVLQVDLPAAVRARGALSLNLNATLHEVGGRGVSAWIVRPVDPSPYYLGLRVAGDAVAGGRTAVEVAAVAPDGTAAAVGAVRATVSKLEWTYALREDSDGRLRYQSECTAVVLQEQEVSLTGGRGRFDLESVEWGSLRITVEGTGAGAPRASQELYLGSWGYQPVRGMRVDRVEIVPDKARYRPGETARVTVRAPFSGRLLLFVQRETTLWTRQVELTDGRGEVEVPILPGYAPNVYCAATVVRSLKKGETWGAHRAYGVAPLGVDCTDKRLSLAVRAPAELTPGSAMTVTVDVRDAAGVPASGEVVLSAVDEGVLRLTSFATPDPWAGFFGKRRLDVATADAWGNLFPEEGEKSPGGKSESGGGEPMSRRLNPVSVDRVKPVALWQARVPVGPDGRAQATWTLPEFDGALRVMAVAASGERFGSGEGTVLVRRPFIVKETLPRVASCGDRFTVPVVLLNRTGADGTARVGVRVVSLDPAAATGHTALALPLAVEGPDSTMVKIPAGGEATVQFSLAAGVVPGPVRVLVDASLGEYEVEKSTDLAVRPPAPLVRASGYGVVSAGETRNFRTHGSFDPQTTHWSVTVSSGPTLRLGEALRYVLRYPYGCLEQTTSGTLPLLRLKDLSRLADPERFTDESFVDRAVQAGIHRLLAMQTYEGGMSTWSGGGPAYPYGSVYAAQCLLEAEAAGYSVPPGCRDALLTYIRKRVVDVADSRNANRALQAYGCAVLALAGDPPLGVVQRLLRNPEVEQGDVRAYLAKALMRAGRKAEAVGLLGAELPPPGGAPELAGPVVSAVGETAILLDAYLDVDPDSPAVPVLVQRLHDGMRGERWPSTHDNALALLALGKYAQLEAARAHGSGDAPLTGTLEIAGARRGLDGTATAQVTGKGGAEREFSVSAQGKGRFFVYWTEEGVPRSGRIAEADSNLTVRRQYYQRDGTRVEADQGGVPVFRAGETYVVELTLRAHRACTAVAVADLLPAGLEIENPRIATSDWQPVDSPQTLVDSRGHRREAQLVEPDHVEMRDDRLLLFAVPPVNHVGVYRYVVRAVTRGEFVLPAVAAECMYDPSWSSVSGQGTVRVGD